MPRARALPAAALAALLLALASAGAAEKGPLPTPVEEVPVFPVEASADDRGVRLAWPAREGAASYAVYVNPDAEEIPTWTKVGEVGAGGPPVHTFRDEDPPAPREGRTSVSYAVLALDPAGAPLAEGRVAVAGEALEAAGPGVPRGAAVLLGVVVALLVAGVAFALLRGRRGR